VKVKKSEFTRLMEARREGRVASMTWNDSYENTPVARRLGDYFRKQMPNYDGIYEEEVFDDVLDAINQYMEEKGIDHAPLRLLVPGEESYLLPVTENLELVVIITDDYSGGGNYEMYVEISSFLVNDQTTEEDVDRLVDMLKAIMGK